MANSCSRDYTSASQTKTGIRRLIRMCKRVKIALFPVVVVASMLAQVQSPVSRTSLNAAQLRTVRADVPTGKVESASVEDPSYKKSRHIWIYTPPGYDTRKIDGYDLLLCFDGGSYIAPEEMALPTVLDNLVAAKKIRPTVAVMVDNGSGGPRLGDLANSAAFTKFVGEVLVPWARKNYNLSKDPARSTISGYSAGGLAAANIAFFYPNEFGNVLAQSPALWRGAEASNDEPYEWLTEQVKAAPQRSVRFYIEVGELETVRAVGVGPVFLDAAKRFRDTLVQKGYSVRFKEVPNAKHEMTHWRDEMVEGLRYLVGQ